MVSPITKYQLTPAELEFLRATPVRADKNRAGLPKPKPFNLPVRKPKSTPQ